MLTFLADREPPPHNNIVVQGQVGVLLVDPASLLARWPAWQAACTIWDPSPVAEDISRQVSGTGGHEITTTNWRDLPDRYRVNFAHAKEGTPQ